MNPSQPLEERTTTGEGGTPSGEEGRPLEEVSRREQDYLRDRLRDELGREPTDEELSEWQRQHTEGY